MKANIALTDLRSKKADELLLDLEEIIKKMARLKLEKSLRRLQKSSELGGLKVKMARLKTILREKELGLNAEIIQKSKPVKSKTEVVKSKTEVVKKGKKPLAKKAKA